LTQQLAFWNAHHDERGFASMHIYHVVSGTPVVTILKAKQRAYGARQRAGRLSLFKTIPIFC
jgi:hypothetical protein